MSDGSLEVATEFRANDPVHHEATEGGASSNAVFNINVVKVVANILPAELKVLERSTTPVVLDIINELLAKASAAGRVGGHNDVALVSPNTGVPASAPAVGPRALGTAVDEESKGVFLFRIESSWLDDPSMVLMGTKLVKVQRNLSGLVGGDFIPSCGIHQSRSPQCHRDQDPSIRDPPRWHRTTSLACHEAEQCSTGRWTT